jgi:hypothetical protein
MSRYEQPPPDQPAEAGRAPAGYRIVWVETEDARLVEPGTERKCRRPGCQRPAVWELQRSNGWWAYCDWHHYGKRIRGKKILSRRVVEKE